ncbi:MAG: GTPase HflX [Candidatus Babeliaceae bacterium]|nr:GTPase HflX [Candidatus Babeliaceae bacterium]
MKTPVILTNDDQTRVLIIGVQTPENRLIDTAAYFAEFRQLVESSGIPITQEYYVKLRTIDNAYFFTKGKLDEILALCAEYKIDDVIVSEPLMAHQERNLSKLLDARVFDRTELILDIFERGAQSAEGKLQVEVAKLRHRKSRLAGKGIHLSQQTGRIGTRGPGETQKERELQHIEHHMIKLQKDLEQLEKVRTQQRKRRVSRQIPHISIIGYTNAGKSSILNLLTKSTVLAENRLFATLDTTTRELVVNGVKKGTISDTVGFIQNLPHHLIEAFKSTLADLEFADLLLHVVDISNPNWQHQIKVVFEILSELGVEDKPMLFVFNKVDLLSDEKRTKVLGLIDPYRPYVVVSAQSKDEIKPLIEALEQWKSK